MGQKINPIGIRLSINRDWDSKWYTDKYTYSAVTELDFKIREYLYNLFKKMNFLVSKCIIKRSLQQGTDVIIKVYDLNLILKKKRESAEILENLEHIKKTLIKLTKTNVNISIIQISHIGENATILAQYVAELLQRRQPFRQVLKQASEEVLSQQSFDKDLLIRDKRKPKIKLYRDHIEEIQSSVRRIHGIRINCSGRLNGVAMARTEWVKEGQVPLQTLNAKIDYGFSTAFTVYGTCGVKVWIYYT